MSPPGPAPHHAPQPGRTPGYQIGEGSPTGAADFITVQGRLFAPLEGLAANDVTLGGYRFLDGTDVVGGVPQTLHPGVDLNATGGGGGCNADLGLAVVAPLAGIVRAAIVWDGSTSGEGNHLWLELDDPVAPGPTWVHFDHLDGFEVVDGQRVAPGQLLGWCGRSGNWDCAHLHTEFLKAPPPDGYWTWPYGWSRAQVEAVYYRPLDWWNAASARVQGAPEEAVVAILNGAQQAAVQAAVWAEHWNPDAADFAIPTSWREEWKAGRWPGAPLGPEQPIPASEDKPEGRFQVFARGCACWLPGEPVSWDG